MNRLIRLVNDRREEHIPEVRRRHRKLDRYQRTIGSGLGRARHMRFDLSLRCDILNGDFRSLRERLSQRNQRASRTDSVSGAFDGLAFPGDLDSNRHTKQHTLRAAPLFRSERARQARLRPVSRIRSRSGWWLFHSSNPQKFISGETSSIPYSQPSGRGLPFHTTTEGLLIPDARFVSDRR